LQPLLAYSERHFDRLNDLLRKSYLVDYTHDAMGLLAIEEEKTEVEVEVNQSDPVSMDITDFFEYSGKGFGSVQAVREPLKVVKPSKKRRISSAS